MFMKIQKPQSDPIREWVLANRGIQKSLSKYLEVTRQHVQGVLRQKHYSEDGLIEGLLADLGAPGMRERQKEAQLKSRGKQWTEAEKKRLTDRLRKLKTSGSVS